MIDNPERDSDIPYVGFVAASAISEKMLYVAGALYFDPEDPITDYTRVYVYNPDLEGNWFYHDVDGQVIDVCFLPASKDQKRLGCALNDSNDVEFRNTDVSFTENIRKIDLSSDVDFNRIKVLSDSHLYACGSDGAVMKRDNGRWEMISEAIFRKPLKITATSTTEDIIAAGDRIEIFDLCMTQGGDIYAVGQEGFIALAVNGKYWQVLDLPYKEHFGGIYCDGDSVWIAGFNGVLLFGNAEKGFVDVSDIEDSQNFGPVDKYNDTILLGAYEGLFEYKEKVIRKVQTNTRLDTSDLHCQHLEVVGNVIWVICDRAIFRFDGAVWHEIEHKDTEK